MIGGGPGGAAVAALLAEAGLACVLVEREKHPRFHIGESLLPHSLPLLDRLGVLERVAAIGVRKPGAEFVSADGEKTTGFAFARALTSGPDHAFQVRRDQFDALLFDRARELGALCLEEAVAEVISIGDEGAVAQVKQAGRSPRLFHADVLIDASGRSALMAKKRREQKPDPTNRSAAIFGHFRGVPHAEGTLAGAIRIHLTEPGWMWQIPLPDGLTSIGLVADPSYLSQRDCGIDAFFDAHCDRHPALRRLLLGATRTGRMQATGNFSYRADTASGPGHLKVGDAYGFIDPMFSTGVHLALSSAAEAAAAVLATRSSEAKRATIFAAYDQKVRERIHYVSWFIYRIHNPTFREMLLNPKDVFGIERAVISLLAGDFERRRAVDARLWLFKAIWRVLDYRNTRTLMSHG
ncbi:MAG: tryptophan 7-halogenase [Pseudomonadota bacterium]